MLSEVLSKESCAKCRFCCSFRRSSLWELPRLPADFAEKYKTGADGKEIRYIFDECEGVPFAVTDLTGGYTTEDPEEEVRCPFLDPQRGCTLPAEDKPFDCGIWPIRYMRTEDGSLQAALTPTCPEINKLPKERLAKLLDDGLREKIAAYAEEHPYMIKPFRQGFTVFKKEL